MPLAPSLLRNITKNYGEFTLYQPSKDTQASIDTIPTGSILLDRMVGGGVPRGRITEIFGPESSGKTTLALTLAAQAQKQGLTTIYFAVEPIDTVYAAKIGVEVWEDDRFYLASVAGAEIAMEICKNALQSDPAPDLIIIDSIAALVPEAEMEAPIGNQHMGLHPRIMSKSLKIISPLAEKTHTAVVLINQIRASMDMYGPKHVTPGGWAMKFYPSLRLDLRQVRDKSLTDGIRVRAYTRKNKVARPFKECEFVIKWDVGIISGPEEIFEAALGEGYITRRGAYYYHDGDQLGQGKDAAIATITAQGLFESLKTLIQKGQKDEISPSSGEE